MLTNIGHVTETLKTLISGVLNVNNVTNFQVTAAPPDAAGPADRIVSVYMFHVRESPDLKNLPPTAGSGSVPVRHEPMGLILQYIVTAVTPEDEDNVMDANDLAIEQQNVIGIIARGIHDYPIVSDKTRNPDPSGTPPFVLQDELTGIGTVLRVNIRPASMEETVSFWTAQDKSVPRLSLFLEARVILLEAQPPEVAPGIVLSVGQFVFTSADPQLVASRSTTWFLPPPNRAPRSVQASPARVAVFDASAPPFMAPDPRVDNNLLTLESTGLGPGKRVLVLKSPTETIRIALDYLVPALIPADNQPWQLTATASSVSLRVFQVVQDDEGMQRTVAPGFYTARVIVLDERAGGVARPRSSNEVSLMIVPQVVSAAPTGTTNLYTLTLATASVPQDGEVIFSVGGFALVANTDVMSSLAPGQYRPAFSGSSPAAVIDFMLPLTDPANPSSDPITPADDDPLTVRLVINGVTATPEWLTDPAP